MPRALRVQWTITSKLFPQPWRFCSRCNEPKPFRCGEKFRLNANGKRLDAWLIYKCAVCDETWNRPIVERRAAKDFDAAMLAGFETNDPLFVRRFALDTATLRRDAYRIEEPPEAEVSKRLISDDAAEKPRLEVHLTVPVSVALRLDRLLAAELGLPRSRIVAFGEAGRLSPMAALRRPIRDNTVVVIEPPDAEAALIWSAAV